MSDLDREWASHEGTRSLAKHLLERVKLAEAELFEAAGKSEDPRVSAAHARVTALREILKKTGA